MSETSGSAVVKWVAGIALLAIAAGGTVWYLRQPGEEGADYKTGEVTRGDLTQAVTATGQLNPLVNVQVGSQVSGIIQKLSADFNSRVTNGQLIAQLDPATYKAAVMQAEGELANARAGLELAKINERRTEELLKGKLIPQSDADNAGADLHKAEAQVMIRQGALEKARVDLERTTINAPIDGIVISRNVDVGQTVAASLSAPTLFVIANDLAKMQIDAMVSEADVGGIEVEQEVSFTVDAFPTRTFHGKVVQVRNSPVTVQNVVTYDTVIEVNNHDLKLKPGMTANVSIVIAQRENVLKVPNAALRFRPAESGATSSKPAATAMTTNSNRAMSSTGSGSPDSARPRSSAGGGGPGRKREGGQMARTLYTLSKTNAANGRPVPVPVQVKLGISDGIFTEVLDGLKEGDVVISGVNQPQGQAQKPTTNPFGGGGMRGIR
jgi:HlyD family secretion protein